LIVASQRQWIGDLVNIGMITAHIRGWKINS